MARARGIAPGDVVYILEGEEEDSWGIVDEVDDSEIHVAIAGGGAPRLYDRNELHRPRDQEKVRRAFGIA